MSNNYLHFNFAYFLHVIIVRYLVYFTFFVTFSFTFFVSYYALEKNGGSYTRRFATIDDKSI